MSEIQSLLRESLSEKGIEIQEALPPKEFDEAEYVGRAMDTLAGLLAEIEIALKELQEIYKRKKEIKSSYAKKLFFDGMYSLEKYKKSLEGSLAMMNSFMGKYVKGSLTEEEQEWIQQSIKQPGRIKELCGGKVTDSCLDELERKAKKMLDSDDAEKKSEGRSLLSAVNLARRFRKGDLKHD